MKKLPLLAACGLLPTLAATAAPLPELVVSATRSAETRLRTAAQITVIDRQEIEASGARTLPELLRGRAGIQVRDLFGDGSNATIDMRGFGATAASNTLVMVDGRRLNPSSDSATLYLNGVDLDEVERVKIVQGSSGVLFGNQAVGGVINLITRRPGTPGATLHAGYGSYDTRELGGQASGRGASGWGYRVSARRRLSDNYRDHNDSRLHNATFLVDHRHDGGRVSLEHEVLDERLQTPGALFLDEAAADPRQSLPIYAGDFIDTRSGVTRLAVEQRLSDRWRFAGEIGYRDDDRSFVQSFRTFAGSRASQDREVWDITPRLVGDLEIGGHDTRLTLGADLQRSDYLLVSAFGPQGVDQAIDAYYGQAVITLAPRWELTAGVRHARVENDIDDGGTPVSLDDDVTIGALGLVFRPAPGWRLYARADQNYRFAKVDEHTNPIFGQPTGLKNQTGVSYELGGSYDGGPLSASLLLYQLDLHDEISFDASGFANVNLDQTRRRGLGLSLSYRPAAAWWTDLGYDYIDGRITSGPNDGRRIPLVPRHRLRGALGWRPRPDTRLELEALYVGDQPFGGDFANRFPLLDGYTLVNLAARWASGPWRLNLRLDNLLDRDYAESGNVGFDLGGSGHPDCIAGFFDSCPAVNPSPGRNLWASLAYRFGP